MPLKAARSLERDALREYAAALLADKALSTAELRIRLRRRAAVAADVEALIETLSEYGALDDKRFAAHFAEVRAAGGRYGKQRVLAGLIARRVAPETAREAVESAFAGVDEAAAAGQWLAKKYRRQDLCVLLRQKSKFAAVYRRLRLAGFAGGAALAALRRIGGQAVEEWEASADDE